MKKDALFWLLLLGGLALLGTGGVIVYNQTRGLRNNNPGNIRLSSNLWLGQSPDQTDGAFVQFSDAKYGIRALARILMNYSARGLTTVRDIISTYAPSSENDTDSYVSAVAARLGIDPDQPFDVVNSLPALVPAIIEHENGLQPYSAQTIAAGISLA